MVKFNSKCTFPRLNATLFEAVAFNLGQICNTMVIWRIGSSPAGKGKVHMNKPKTHMTLDDRIAIQEGLNNNLSVRAIAKTINKSPSTVKREIDARKCPKGRRSVTVLPNCANRKDYDAHGLCKDTRCDSPCRNCISCKKLCDWYVPRTCGRLEAIF